MGWGRELSGQLTTWQFDIISFSQRKILENQVQFAGLPVARSDDQGYFVNSVDFKSSMSSALSLS